MKNSENTCFKCEGSSLAPTEELYGYVVCEVCKSKMGLFRDETIQRHVDSYARAKEADPSQPDYAENVRNRLREIEKTYIGWRIKLLHIQERMGEMGQ